MSDHCKHVLDADGEMTEFQLVELLKTLVLLFAVMSCSCVRAFPVSILLSPLRGFLCLTSLMDS